MSDAFSGTLKKSVEEGNVAKCAGDVADEALVAAVKQAGYEASIA